ncbi:hypothetical protein CRUP_017968 [Coryphaenoides rupestris]|nr:hypothetical protein CRUP_017968 [Coryphaenoides rupestris]
MLAMEVVAVVVVLAVVEVVVVLVLVVQEVVVDAGDGGAEVVVEGGGRVGLGGVAKVACGADHTLALTGDGGLFQWGRGAACGNFLPGNILQPQEVMSSTGSPVTS